MTIKRPPRGQALHFEEDGLTALDGLVEKSPRRTKRSNKPSVDMVRMTIDVPSDLRRRLRQEAANNDTTIRQIVLAALGAHLGRD